MNARASTLDVEKFRKVHALMTGGATEGERQAARARAHAMAEKAGMTFLDAVSMMDSPQPKPKPANFFDGFHDWMEEREPGYNAKRAREEAEREARYAARRAEILKEFGTVKAFFDPTPREELLLAAGRPFVTKWESWEDVCGTRRKSASEFAGRRHHFGKIEDVDPKAVAAIRSAVPFPETLREAFEELRSWDKLNRDRAHFYDHHEYYFDLRIELRIDLLREVMKNRPVASWADLETRFHYKSYAWQQQWIDERDFEDEEWSRLFADFQILRKTEVSPPAQTGYRTTAQKRADVLSMLDANPELSSREIARRVGVSPQTVATWRAKCRDGSG